jgi:hypothetical protein
MASRRIDLHRVLDELKKVQAQLEAERGRLEGTELRRLEALIKRLEGGWKRVRSMCPETQVLWVSRAAARRKPSSRRKRSR